MSALAPGTTAPHLSLHSLDGQAFCLPHDSPAVLIFFKSECPTCQYAIPFFERLFVNKLKDRDDRLAFVGISQNDAGETREFVKQYGVTFPVLLEERSKYAISNAYGLTNVPTIFLISAQGTVEFTSVGWMREDMNELNRRIANLTDAVPVPLFNPGEQVLDFKAG